MWLSRARVGIVDEASSPRSGTLRQDCVVCSGMDAHIQRRAVEAEHSLHLYLSFICS
jgi:hypothetical protein